MINQNELKEILDYDPNTGQFIWKKILSNRIKIGTIAGCNSKDDYIQIKINNKIYRAHRLAWLYITGNWPANDIDHINGIRNDNRFCNLREATDAENHQNRGITSKNTSGYIGVSWHKLANKWVARIKINKKSIYLGLFDESQEAHQAYLNAKQKYHTFNPTQR